MFMPPVVGYGYFLESPNIVNLKNLILLTRFFKREENETSHEAQFPAIVKIHCELNP